MQTHDEIHRRTRLAARASARASLAPCCSLVGALLLSTSPCAAESKMMLWAPSVLEDVGATTFDENGEAVGESSFEVETDPDGRRHMYVKMAIEGGGSNLSQATFVPVNEAEAADGDTQEAGPENEIPLRLVEQRSQATTAEGVSFPLLVIEHEAGRVSCYPANEAGAEPQHVDIPDEDRVVNVPMQLLFMPLVRGEVDTLRFQIAMCKPEPSLYKMIAVRSEPIVRDGREIIQVKYGPDLGKTVAWFASRLLPSFAFWFDARDGQYLGHRMPLHREGPEVLLVRRGLTPPDIGIE
jgi:hypothetical protein